MLNKLLIIGFLIVALLGFGLVNRSQPSESSLQPTVTPTQMLAESLSYEGKKGIDALTLLKEQASVEQEASGLVVGINGRKASPDKREYWAFYVNGELAPVGPAQYITKDGDRIEWKVENY